jgi:hypothetical protein
VIEISTKPAVAKEPHPIQNHVEEVKAAIASRGLTPSRFNHSFEYELIDAAQIERDAPFSARELPAPPFDGIKRRRWVPSPEFRQHLEWLVARVIDGQSPKRLAASQAQAGVDAATHIRKVTTAIAKFIEVEPRGSPRGAHSPK